MKETILISRCRPNEVALNPGLLAHDSGYLLATRLDAIDPCHVDVRMKAEVWQFWGRTRIRIDDTDSEFEPTGRVLEFDEAEDPRLFRAAGALWIAFCRAWRQWVMPFGVDHHFERCGEAFTPNYERNQYMTGRPEKNWTWIDGTKDSLDCIYRWEPFQALRFTTDGACIEKWRNNAVILPWRHGKINGGTPSVMLPSGERFSVFHSHLGDPRVYYVGGIYHRAEWPYEPIRVLCKPLFAGDTPGHKRFTRWPLMETGQRCAAAFPCGLVAKPDGVLISYGIGDCVCAVAEFDYDELKYYDTAA